MKFQTCISTNIAQMKTLAPTQVAIALTKERLTQKWGLPRQDIYVDCRDLKNRKAKEHKEHTGYNIQILRSIVKDPNFESLARNAHQELLDEFSADDKEPFRAMFVCNHGCHRSVAAAIIMKEVWLKMGYRVGGPHHVSKKKWQERRLCLKCAQCDDGHWGREEVIATAFNFVKDL